MGVVRSLAAVVRTPRAPENWRQIVRRGRRLVQEDDSEGIVLLTGALRWRYDTARNEAVKALASMGESIIPLLVRMLNTAETAVERRASADALGLIGGAHVVPPLMRALRDPNMVVRRAAIAALLRVRAPDAPREIARLLRDESGGVRVLAAGALGRFGDPSVAPAMIRSLEDEKWYVRQAAAVGLGELQDPRARTALRRAAEDSRPAVANAARAALEKLGKSRN